MAKDARLISDAGRLQVVLAPVESHFNTPQKAKTYGSTAVRAGLAPQIVGEFTNAVRNLLVLCNEIEEISDDL